MRGATELLEHLPVEHGCLGFTGNLNACKQKRKVTAGSGCGHTASFKLGYTHRVSLYFKGRSKVAANLSAEVSSYLKAHRDMKLNNSGGHVVQGLLLCTADPQTHAM